MIENYGTNHFTDCSESKANEKDLGVSFHKEFILLTEIAQAPSGKSCTGQDECSILNPGIL